MSIYRRFLLVAMGAGLMTWGSTEPPQAHAGEPGLPDDRAVADLIAQSARANAALMRGDIGLYTDLVELSDDFTLMSPFGGAPTHARDITSETMEAMGRFFRNGTLEQEVVQTYRSPRMIVLVVTEHAHVEVGGLPAQNWPLRVTLVYQQRNGRWLLVHRHADPLVAGITLS